MTTKTNKKKVAEFKLNFDLKNIFIIIFIVLFSFYAFRSISKEVNQLVPEKSITSIVADIKNNKTKNYKT